MAMGFLGSIAQKSQKGFFGPQTDEAAKQAGVGQMIDWYNRAGNDFSKYYDQAKALYDPANALLADPSSVRNLPGYQFNFDQGMKALDNSAAARGGALSGNALRGATEYGQGYADSQWGNQLARILGVVNPQAGILQGQGQGLANIWTGLGANIPKYRIAAMDEARQMHDSMNEAAAGWTGAAMGSMGGMGGGKKGGGNSSQLWNSDNSMFSGNNQDWWSQYLGTGGDQSQAYNPQDNTGSLDPQKYLRFWR